MYKGPQPQVSGKICQPYLVGSAKGMGGVLLLAYTEEAIEEEDDDEAPATCTKGFFLDKNLPTTSSFSSGESEHVE